METRVVKADKAGIAAAAAALKAGGVVVLPTETVYGLAADLGKSAAVARVLELRGNADLPRIVWHAGSIEEAKIAPCGVLGRMVRKFWPGPLTIIPASGEAVRVTSHKAALEIIRVSGVRVGATAACLPAGVPAVTGEEAVAQFRAKVDVIVDDGATKHRNVSTVVRIASPRLDVVREGAIPRSVLDEINVASILFVCSGNTCRSPMAERLMRRAIAKKFGVGDGEIEAQGYRILSAGTGAAAGSRASDEAVAALKENGIDAEDHRSRPVTRALVEDADRIYAMMRTHLRAVQGLAPVCAANAALLDPSGADVADPFGSSLTIYRESLKRIQELVQKRMGEIG
jgi:protein-tyrosine phosphatase